MTSHTSTVAPSATPHQVGHARLHKRGGSGSAPSLPAPTSSYTSPRSQFTTPYATYEEPLPNPPFSPTAPTSSTSKIKPYLRKKSSAKEDQQGKIDLSKSVGENAGLGVQDFGTNSASASDVSFVPAGRRTTHARSTSIGSQVSNGSGFFRPNQPFVHPMRQTPRPYTPPTGSSNNSFVNGEEADESDDVVDDDFRLGHGFRNRRSVSVSSTPQVAPTPLSQSHTADDLGLVPKLTSTSQTNLSVKSGRSSRSKLSRRRGDTNPSFDLPTSPSSRTSFDKALSYMSRRSDPEHETRDERIRAARRKFEEKEANKDRKVEKGALKRRETEEARTAKKRDRQRRKSETSSSFDRTRATRDGPEARSSGAALLRKAKPPTTEDPPDEKLRARSYEANRPANAASLPRRGREPGAAASEEKKGARGDRTVRRGKGRVAQSSWVRFSAWLRTRMLGCGG